jgi:broad specificity phosphatase PhoE
VQAFYEDPWNWREHGGETDADVVARAWPPIERALGRYGGPLAVACHYNVIRVVVADLLGIPPPASFRLRVDLTAACTLRDAPGGWTLVRSNVRGNGLAR